MRRGPRFETIRMIADVGSDCRVDWDEIGAHWLEDIKEGDE